jgi:predicted aspartyl protease
MKLALASHADEILADCGAIPQTDVRRVKVNAGIDDRNMHLVLPASAVDVLGLEPTERTKGRLADASIIERDVVRDVSLTLLGRTGVFKAIIEPNRDDALIGAIVLEDLDVVADPVAGTCHPVAPGGATR